MKGNLGKKPHIRTYTHRISRVHGVHSPPTYPDLGRDPDLVLRLGQTLNLEIEYSYILHCPLAVLNFTLTEPFTS